MKTGRIFIEVSSQMYQIVTQICITKRFIVFYIKWDHGYFYQTINFIKLLDPYKTRGNYILHTMAISKKVVDSFI